MLHAIAPDGSLTLIACHLSTVNSLIKRHKMPKTEITGTQGTCLCHTEYKENIT